MTTSPFRAFASAQKSTIVRSSFWMLARVAPRLAARQAERVWFTIPRFPAGPDAPGGAPFRLGAVTGHTWGDGPPVYLLHGWGGNAAQLAGFVAPLVAAGFRVVAFDTPSHGRSGPGRFGPRSSSIPEFADALTAVAGRFGPAHAVVAHSMGTAATAVALCDGLPVGRVVLLAPVARPDTYAGQLRVAMGLTGRAYRHLIDRVEQRVGAPMRHFDVPALAAAVAMPPALIVHDTDDRVTPAADAREVVAAWAGARRHETTGLGHTRLLRDPAVIAEVTAFLTADRLPQDGRDAERSAPIPASASTPAE